MSETPQQAAENRLSWEKVDRAFEPQRAAVGGGCALVSMPAAVAGLGAALATKDAVATAGAAVGIAVLGWTVYAAYKRLTAPGRRDRSPD